MDATSNTSGFVDLALDKLKRFYTDRNRITELGAELLVYQQLMPALISKLEPTYELIEPVGLGSTAIVWKVMDNGLKPPQPRALKLTRPNKSRSDEIVRIIRGEPLTLASLNHQNIIKVFTYSEISFDLDGASYKFPYFVMEFLAERSNFDDAILTASKKLNYAVIIDFFRDALSGIDALHSQNIVHCDIKPANILVPPNRPALIADLGYAKHIPRGGHDSQITKLITTRRYARPYLLRDVKEASNPSATVVEIRRDQLHKKYDLFAFGRTMQEVLWKLRLQERRDEATEYGRESVFTSHQWQYLSIVSKRLLDGWTTERPTGALPEELHDEILSDVARTEISALYQDCIPGIAPTAMKKLSYVSAIEALEDIEKLQHLYDLEGRIPELNPNLRTFIQIPHCQVPLTTRVRAVINHPAFQRVSQTTQLGFVSMVYPGARHTRYEHVLGAFWHCCQYLRALWYDQTNAFFQCVMRKKDLDLALLAALLHDVSQYPMAHDLTEVDDRFRHEAFLCQALEMQYVESVSLADVLRNLWQVEIEEVLNVLNANEQSDVRYRVLHSVLDGALDCDKLDYVRRDSLHLGVSFGSVIDHERLFRNLTTVRGEPTDLERRVYEQSRTHEHHPGVAEIGVAEKALAVAKSLLASREDMFRQVYWQHTTRSLKAMLAFVTRGILSRLSGSAQEDAFWESVRRYVFNPGAYYSPGSQTDLATKNSRENFASFQPNRQAVNFQELFDDDAAEEYPVKLSSLDPSDDSLLGFLYGHANEVEQSMISLIRSRMVFERVAVISCARLPEAHEQLYAQFRNWRRDRSFLQMEAQRAAWESQIKQRLQEELLRDPRLVPQDYSADEITSQLDKINPLILVDIPLKATSKKNAPTYLRYVREDPFLGHRFNRGDYSRFESFDFEKDETEFDRKVGKIRVLCDPRWRDLLIWVLGEEIRSIIIGQP